MAEKTVLHDVRLTDDGLTACCEHDPRSVGALTDDPSKVTCQGDQDTKKASN
jgi:hypothetical protein